MCPKDQLVAVTGATGFVGAHIVKQALENGYAVRSVVRSQEKGKQLLEHFPSSNHTVSFVPDIRDKEALEKAFHGVKVVQHVASPYTMAFDDARSEMLDPAIQGTLAVLEAADKQGVEHVIITSSYAAINCYEKGGAIRDYTYTEDDWNPATYDGAAASPNKVYIYSASKALAEKAAWNYLQKRPSFALTTFCPPGIVGPIVHPVKALDQLNTSCANVWRLISGQTNGQVPPTLLPQTVDVRDVAKAHVYAMSNPRSKGERFILRGYYIDMQVIVDYLREIFPSHRATIPVGEPGTRNQPGPVARLDASKAERLLGMTWTTWNETYKDLATQLWDMSEKQ